MSFFGSSNSFILEIGFELSDTYLHESVFSVYDFSHWKIRTNHSSIDFSTEQSRELLKKAKSTSQRPFGALVSSAQEIEIAAQYANFLYIPGELCRQSDILEAATLSRLPLIVERGCFLAPSDVIRIVEKLKDADVALVDCGTANGYSDSVLDPRVLFLMQKTGKKIGIHLSDLLSPEAKTYSHRPKWLSEPDFIQAFVCTGKALGVTFYVVKSYGKGAISTDQALKYTLGK
ncbi:hypothetical protein [Fluviispira sanaruensis]|uniref:Uncharacterized protein n=1 Tax=Fluviispira sanaruensis TaxID=2493639 RepID=A0A4P2VJN5_FLUSA|nr:hypothetical protein [Fluviispira sanaruensis]BBH52931.1 hypothetical protein JCM31447_13740 [Fluviispira sanaruensis]